MLPARNMIVIAGPTAVGKTSIAIEVAQHFNTSIISADSRQCYKEMNIGVARPSEEELKKVPHYFIASHSIREPLHAAAFAAYALKISEEIFADKKHVILTGGTGLYIRAFLEGMDEIPQVPPEIRWKLMDAYQANGLEWLQDEVSVKDPAFFAQGEIYNPQRLLRALEVFYATGKSILEFRKGKKAVHDFNVIKIALDLPREVLYSRINDRVDQMIANGLVDEVKALLPFKTLNALQTVGYKEIFDHLEGKLSLDEAVALIKQNTRHYAKRQLTWFRKDEEYVWMKPEAEKVIAYLNCR